MIFYLITAFRQYPRIDEVQGFISSQNGGFTFCWQETIFPYELNHKNTQNRFKNIVISLEIPKKMSFWPIFPLAIYIVFMKTWKFVKRYNWTNGFYLTSSLLTKNYILWNIHISLQPAFAHWFCCCPIIMSLWQGQGDTPTANDILSHILHQKCFDQDGRGSKSFLNC